MTNEQLSVALSLAAEIGPARFGTVGDISCDIEVSSVLRHSHVGWLH